MAEELNNPLFDDEREFLERKKQEYERALRGDVEHIKEQSVQVGKVAAVGAGLAGTIWLISKALGGGRKRKAQKQKQESLRAAQAGSRSRDAYYDDADDEFQLDHEAFALDLTTEFRDYEHDEQEGSYADGGRYQGGHSARESAQVFLAQGDDYDEEDEDDNYRRPAPGYFETHFDDSADDQDFDNGFANQFGDDDDDDQTRYRPSAHAADDDDDDLPAGRLDFGPAVHLHKQGSQQGVNPPVSREALAYDDSRRLPSSAEFPASPASRYQESEAPQAQRRDKSLGQQAGQLVKSFLDTGTGKAVAAQATALGLAYVAKLINDRLPVGTLGKNADLADAPATTSFYPPATPASSASTPAVSLTFTDAPTEHPAT